MKILLALVALSLTACNTKDVHDLQTLAEQLDSGVRAHMSENFPSLLLDQIEALDVILLSDSNKVSELLLPPGVRIDNSRFGGAFPRCRQIFTLKTRTLNEGGELTFTFSKLAVVNHGKYPFLQYYDEIWRFSNDRVWIIESGPWLIIDPIVKN